MRAFGVEEELLLVDARTRLPLAAGEDVVRRSADSRRHDGSVAYLDRGQIGAGTDAPRCHLLTVELQQEQVEIVGPPLTTMAEQVDAIKKGRMLADSAARSVGGRALALGTPVSSELPHLVPDRRYRRIRQHAGLLAAEQLTCGFHVHVQIDGREEGVAVLDRIRVWLPLLLALSTNSPFWYGVESGFASYRYQAWSRWPTAGPCEIFGSPRDYDLHVKSLLRSGVPLDQGMLYFDARLSARFPTVEVRVADVCLDPTHAAVVATLIRALVETASRQWRRRIPPPPATAAQLRVWTWRASRFGIEELLVSPSTGTLAPAGHVVAELLDLIGPVLDAYGEHDEVHAAVACILRDGTGTRRQRDAYARRHDLLDVVDTALAVGTPPSMGPPSGATLPGPIGQSRAS